MGYDIGIGIVENGYSYLELRDLGFRGVGFRGVGVGFRGWVRGLEPRSSSKGKGKGPWKKMGLEI